MKRLTICLLFLGVRLRMLKRGLGDASFDMNL